MPKVHIGNKEIMIGKKKYKRKRGGIWFITLYKEGKAHGKSTRRPV